MSYDPLGVLASFAERHGITYPLLADEGSREIERLGLRNHHVAEIQAHFDRPVEAKHHGLPYPGTFVIDEDGLVADKWFEVSHRLRPSGTSLLADVGGRGVVTPVVSDEAEADGVRLAAWVGTDRYHPLQVLRVHVVVDVPEPLHVYGDPVPPGYRSLRIALGPEEALTAVGPAPLPEPRPFEVAGLDERFHVHEGRIETQVPFAVVPGVASVELVLTVTVQACTDRVCHPPTTRSLRLPLTARSP